MRLKGTTTFSVPAGSKVTIEPPHPPPPVSGEVYTPGSSYERDAGGFLTELGKLQQARQFTLWKQNGCPGSKDPVGSPFWDAYTTFREVDEGR